MDPTRGAKALLTLCGLFFFTTPAFAAITDLDADAIPDQEDSEVVVTTNLSLPAGEYTFHNLIISSSSVLTLVGDPSATTDFKGVKIIADNITVESASSISANGMGYRSYTNSPGAGGGYRGGYGYGGRGGDWHYSTESALGGDTYGSAFQPIDLGSGDGTYTGGGGAIWLIVSGTLENNGAISANGAPQQASGGSIYIRTGQLEGSGMVTANGGSCYWYYPNSGAGGGGRIAVYYEQSGFTGNAEALRGGTGNDSNCQLERSGQDGTVVFVDTVNNDLYLYDRLLFQASDSPYAFNRIVLDDSASVSSEPGVRITAHEVDLRGGSSFDTSGVNSFTADSLLIDSGSVFTSAEGQTLKLSSLTLRNSGVAHLGRGETLSVDTISLENESLITAAPMHILKLEARDVTLDETSAISATGAGYPQREGPGYNDSGAGASHGGLGEGGISSPIYGSETEPVDFGSGGSPDANGGGSIRMIISGTLLNNGIVSADAMPFKNGASGGSVYVTTNKLSGSGSFTALGGNTRGYITDVGAGGGGRIAVYYKESDFTGTTSAKGGDRYVGGAIMQTYYAQDGTVVFEKELTGASSVLFLPGIMGSRLYTKDDDGDEDGLWEPNGNQDVRQLAMTENGESIESIYTRDVIDSAYGVKDMYNEFGTFMDGLKDEAIITDWKSYAYDWRYGVVDVANEGTRYEDGIHDGVSYIEMLAASSLSGRVTVVAHSNGGLLAKALLTRLEHEGKAHLIDRIVFLASPQLGTPKAIGVLLHGYDQEQAFGLLIDDAEIRAVAKNMPGVYGLLTSQKYFDKSGSIPIVFETGISTQAFRAAYGTAIDSATELTEFMVGDADGRGEATETYEASRAQMTMLQDALSVHDTILDTWTAPEGVDVIEVVGIGLNTVHQFKYEQFTERKCLFCSSEPVYKPVPQFSLYGDETVMGYSAEAYEGDKQVWYVDLGALENENNPEAVEHADFGNNKSIQILIRNILTEETSDTPFIHTTRPTFSSDTYTILSTHSPVSLEVVDSEGRRVGKGVDIPQTDIPGSTYTEIADSTYIIVPQGIEYDVSIKGTGYGSMTFITESLSNNTQTRISSAEVATITPSTTIAIAVVEDTLSNLMIDVNGDSVIDQELTPQGEVVIPKGTYLLLRSAIKSLPAKYAYKRHLLALINLAEHFDKKSLIKKFFAKFESRILIRIEQTLKYAVNKRQLTQAQISPILKIITSLK